MRRIKGSVAVFCPHRDTGCVGIRLTADGMVAVSEAREGGQDARIMMTAADYETLAKKLAQKASYHFSGSMVGMRVAEDGSFTLSSQNNVLLSFDKKEAQDFVQGYQTGEMTLQAISTALKKAA